MQGFCYNIGTYFRIDWTFSNLIWMKIAEEWNIRIQSSIQKTGCSKMSKQTRIVHLCKYVQSIHFIFPLARIFGIEIPLNGLHLFVFLLGFFSSIPIWFKSRILIWMKGMQKTRCFDNWEQTHFWHIETKGSIEITYTHKEMI